MSRTWLRTSKFPLHVTRQAQASPVRLFKAPCFLPYLAPYLSILVIEPLPPAILWSLCVPWHYTKVNPLCPREQRTLNNLLDSSWYCGKRCSCLDPRIHARPRHPDPSSGSSPPFQSTSSGISSLLQSLDPTSAVPSPQDFRIDEATKTSSS